MTAHIYVQLHIEGVTLSQFVLYIFYNRAPGIGHSEYLHTTPVGVFNEFLISCQSLFEIT